MGAQNETHTLAESRIDLVVSIPVCHIAKERGGVRRKNFCPLIARTGSQLGSLAYALSNFRCISLIGLALHGVKPIIDGME